MTMPGGLTNRLRRNLRSQIKNKFKGKKVCLLLSAGADSTLLGLVAHSLKLDVHALSYERQGFHEDDQSWMHNEDTIRGVVSIRLFG